MLEATGVDIRLGRAAGRRGRDGEVRRQPAARAGARLHPRAPASRSRARSPRPIGGGFRSVNVALRKALDLYACVRPCKYYPGVRSRYDGRRPGDRAREHRGPLRRHRVRAGHARGRSELIAWIERKRRRRLRRATPASRSSRSPISGTRRIVAVRLRLRRAERPPQGHRRAQGQHHEVHRRPLPARRARGRRGDTPATSSSTTASWTTCACSSCRSPSCTTCWCCRTSTATSSPTSAPGLVGGLGVAPGANYRRRRRGLRADPRLGAQVHGPEQGQPDGARSSPGMLMLAPPGRDEAARPAGGRRSPTVIARGQSRHLRHEADPRRPDRGRHQRDGRRDHREAGLGLAPRPGSPNLLPAASIIPKREHV